MNKGHDKGHKGQMSDRDVMRLALEALESASNNEGNFHDYKYAAEAIRQALDHVPDATKMIEPDMGIDRGAWDDVPDATKWVDELRGGDETEEQEPVVLNQFLSDVMTAAGLVKHGKQSKALAARLQVEVMKLHTALRAALEQPEQEPFGYFHYDLGLELWQETGTGDGKPLYAAPPKREWVGLTDEEEIELDEKYGDDFNAYIDARDAKLKEKNGE